MDFFEKLKEKFKNDAKKSGHIKLFESYANKGRDAYKESIAVCGYCGLRQCDSPDIPFHIDHIVPRALGGSEDPEILTCFIIRILCRPQLLAIEL